MTAAVKHLDWVDGTRCVAALAVVLLHAAASAVTDSSLLGSSGWWAANLFDSATRWCVPVFVMLSGALLLAPGHQDQAWADFYRRRLIRVLLPLAFWSLFYLAYDSGWVLARGGEPDWRFMLRQTLVGMPYFHLWFLFMLPGLYLLTPLLRQLLAVLCRRQRVVLCAGLFALAAASRLFAVWRGDGPPFFALLFLPYIGYFLAGHLIATGSRTSRWPWPTLLAGIALTAAGCGGFAEQGRLAAGTYFYDYFSVTTIPAGLAAFALCQRLPAWRLFAWLAPVSFGIYLIHPLLLDLMWQNGLRPTSSHPALAISLLTVAAFAGSVPLAWLLLKLPLLRRVV